MPQFRLITTQEQASTFEPYCGRAQISPLSGNAVFTWSGDSLASDIVSSRIQFNKQGITCICHPVAEIKAAFFDMDSTAIGQETIVELAACAGMSAEVEKITEDAMAGKLDFVAALDQRVATLKGLSTEIYPEVMERLVINPGLKEFSRYATEQNIQLFLVSGGFGQFAKNIANSLGFSGYHANLLDEEEGKLLGTVSGTIVDGKEKKEFLLRTCQNLAIKPSNCLVVGDGANDLNMMEDAGIAIGYHPKPILIEQTHGAIYSDHHSLIDTLTTH